MEREREREGGREGGRNRGRGLCSLLSWKLKYVSHCFYLQEIYWRIPPTMTPAQLNSAADSLKVPVQGAENEGGSGEEEEEEENEREEEDEREEKKEKEEEEKSLVEADDSDDQFNLSDEGV